MADTVVDSLQIEINAKAQTANDAIDVLVDKLDVLSNSLGKINGVKLNGFAESLNSFKGSKIPDFTRLANGIKKLSQVNYAEIELAGNSVRQIADQLQSLKEVKLDDNVMQIANVANAMSRLGGKSIVNATNNVPLLANALNQLMLTLSKAPTVNQSVIDMTNALANLAAQGSKVGSASKSVVNGLNRTNAAAKRASSSTMSLARAFGKFYANYFLLVRGFKGLFKSMESAMELTETVNYFEVTLNNIGENARESWKEYGYESADAYADSFAKRLRESNEKLTGFAVSETGQISQSVFSGLGISPATATQYSAMFAQVANSIGMTEEASIALSEAFVRLGADWASLRNVDFEVAYEKLASGLSGQSRALRAFGVDITMATLQEIAFANGIEKSASEMTQAEKAYLRLIAIIEQSEVAFGDLANTLESPANQMRMLRQNIENLATLVGNLLMPILQKVLPVINGFLLALQRVFIGLSESIGIDTSQINSSIGGMNEGFGDLSEGIDDATESAEKFNRSTRGWDELNVLGKDTSKGYGVGNDLVENEELLDAYSKSIEKYREAWNEAYSKIQSEAEDWADKITPKLQTVVDVIDAISPAVEGALKIFIAYKTMQALKTFAGYFDPARKAILNIVENLDATGQKLTVGNIMSGLRDNLNKTTKLAIGVGSVVTEFNGVYDGVENIASGTGNLLENLGEIATSAGIGATGLYLAFGTTGLAFGAVAGLAGAIKGIVDACNDVADAKIGDVLKNALTPSNGTPLEETVDGLVNKIQGASGEFDAFVSSSSSLTSIEGDIQSITSEIGTIKTAMEQGVISVENGKIRLAELFDQLALLTTQKFETIRLQLLSVFGEDGVISDYLDKIGVGTEETVDIIIQYTYKNEERAKEIVEEMAKLEYGSEKYFELEKELISLSNGYDEASKATDAFNDKISSINWSSVFDDKGNFNFDAVKNVFSEFQTAYDEYSKKLDLVEEETKSLFREMINSGSLSEEQIKTLEETIKGLPQAFDLMESDAKKQIIAFVAMVQTDLLNKTSDIIDGSAKEYKDMNILQRIFSGYGTTGDFVKDALDEYKKAASLIENFLFSYMEELGVETNDMAKVFNEDFVNMLFDKDVISSGGANASYQYTVKKEYSDILDELMNTTKKKWEDIGGETVAGFISGIGDSSVMKDLGNTLSNLVNNILTPVKEGLKINSPSKVTEEYGKFFVEGFNIGIENNMQSTLDIVKGFAKKIKDSLPRFSLFGKEFGFALPQYATGGFPEDGLFMANHSELVGKFSNGKTAVANNDQITKGIEEASYRGMMRALQSADMGNKATFEIVGDPNGMFRVMQKQASQYTKSTGRNAFGY